MSVSSSVSTFLLTSMLTAFTVTAGGGQEPPDTAARSRWTVDDILLQESAGSFAFSPDDRYLVWTKSEVDKKSGTRFSNLWMTRLSDAESWPLTQGKDSFGAPRWSPDGKLVAFSSTRAAPDSSANAGGPQLWLWRLGGGEPWALTTDLRGLRQFEWKGTSGDTIVFTAQDAISERDRERKKDKITGHAVEDTLDSPPVRLWSVAVESKAVRRLTTNPDRIESMALSPDGNRAITRNTTSLSYQFDAKSPPDTYLVDLATGERREILAGPVPIRGRPFRVVPAQMEWARDGAGVYLAYEYSSDPIYRSASITLMGYYDVGADRFVPIELDWARALGGFDVVPGGFLALLQDGVRLKPARFTRSGGSWSRTWIEGEAVGKFTSWAPSRDAKVLAYVQSTASTPPQPYFATLDGGSLRTGKRIAELNPSFVHKPWVRAEVIHWKGARGDEVEGILYYPLDYQAGRRYPLITSIHGGPAGADRDAWTQTWSAPVVLYLQRGAFALKINYHGSCCYGLDWVESIGNGHYYELEVPDIERGVDHLIAQGLVAADSIATAGWSNGAILSTALNVANPARYKAAIVGAGDVEWISDWGNVDFGASFDNYYFGASPIENPARYIEKSPYFKLPNVRTPTLLFTGTDDRNVPPSQSWSHFRALQQIGKVPVRLVLFPGEPHGLRKLTDQRQKVEEEMAWLDRYLWGGPDTTNLALAAGSPLARLLKLDGVARDGRLLGERVSGTLVPETVRRGNLEIGRFEVTRAQWKAFDAGYVVPEGTENYPANGITFERAQAYVAWLSETTGRPFRLPTEDEWRKLGGGSRGNTLDYWAGYAPNPDDVARLSAAIARLGGVAPLLREVGSFAPDTTGGSAVYDLGGNVAEWAVDEASGAPMGGSADRPRDKTARPSEAGEAYRGLRVVIGS